ncbi:hypothetical protein BT69DRAFT_1297472 [Atractiella rhizophila]|nr:hypothetical protein BT69DRAFT_1297472 [Atractiella rhizophila]
MAPNRPTTSPILRQSPHLLQYLQRTFFPRVSPSIVARHLPNSFLRTFTPAHPLPVPAFIARPTRKFKYTRRRQRVLCKAAERVGAQVGAILPPSEVTVAWEAKRMGEKGAVVQGEWREKRVRRRNERKVRGRIAARKGSPLIEHLERREEREREVEAKRREKKEGAAKEVKKEHVQDPTAPVRGVVKKVDSAWQGRGPYLGRSMIFKGKMKERAFDDKTQKREKALVETRKKLKSMKEGREKMRNAKRRERDMPW